METLNSSAAGRVPWNKSRLTGQNGIKPSPKARCAEQLMQMQGITQPYASRGRLFKIQPN